MKKLICSVMASMSVMLVMAQYTVPQVLGSSGSSGSNGNVRLDWTVGETITETHRSPGLVVTQGFHQGNLRFTKKAAAKLPAENAATNLDIQAFPNPTYDFVTLQLGIDDLQNYSYMIYDLAGQEIHGASIETQTTQADFTTLSRATYLLVVKQNEVPVKAFQIIKN